VFQENDIFTTTGVASRAKRLNFRYNLMFKPIGDVFLGASVLDLGSHNGRWSYVAMELGARKVIGIESNKKYVKLANKIFEQKNLDKDLFEFKLQNVETATLPEVDVVLCMGLLYYLKDPIGLLRKVANLPNKVCIIDTFHSSGNVSNLNELQKQLKILFNYKQLGVYDREKRVAFHCYPKKIASFL